jgi:hypothetical protein
LIFLLGRLRQHPILGNEKVVLIDVNLNTGMTAIEFQQYCCAMLIEVQNDQR